MKSMDFKKLCGRAFVAVGVLVGMWVGPDSRAWGLQSPPPRRSPAVTETLLRVGPTDAPPIIDGRLDDSCWQNATMASGFITIGGEWVRNQTTAYITYDLKCLYIAFRCDEPAPEKLSADAKKSDELGVFNEDNVELFNDDNVELFLDTNHDRMTYYHFGINAIGARYEAYCDNSGEGLIRQAEWNPEWELKTRIGTQQWTAEMRIPFASFPADYPRPGTVWGINLNRSRSAGGPMEFASWAMIAKAFNRPEAFGKVVFGTPADVSYSIVSLGDRRADYGLGITLRNGKKTPVAVRTEWAVSTPSLDDAFSKTVTTHLGPGEEREVHITAEVAGRGSEEAPRGVMDSIAELAITVSDAKTGDIYDSRKGSLESLVPMEMYLDRYYYTPDVRQMQVTVITKTEEAAYFEVEIGTEPKREALASRRMPITPDKDSHVFLFNIADWDRGRYVISAHLLSDGGERLFSIHRAFFKKEIGPAKSIPRAVARTVVRSDGVILLDGKPFCPFFTSSASASSPLATDCFNVRCGEVGLVSRPLERLDIGLSYNLPPEEVMLRRIRTVVAARQSDPLLYCWFLQYEAQIPMYRGNKDRGRLDNAEELRKISGFVKSIDPNRVTSIQIDSPRLAAHYRDSADIIEIATKSSYARRLIPNFVRDVDEVREALGPGKAFLIWIGSGYPSPELRTADEIRCASYLALMHGAAGVVFHLGHGGISPSFTRLWSVYPGLSREVEALFTILTIPQPIRGSPVTVQPATIDYRVREDRDRFYLIAVNTAPCLVNARISFAEGSPMPKRVNLLFENREIKPEGEHFTDAFAAFEPHVYEFLTSP